MLYFSNGSLLVWSNKIPLFRGIYMIQKLNYLNIKLYFPNVLFMIPVLCKCPIAYANGLMCMALKQTNMEFSSTIIKIKVQLL